MDDRMPDHDPEREALNEAEGDPQPSPQPEAQAAPELTPQAQADPDLQVEAEAEVETEPASEAQVPRDDGGIDWSFSADLASEVRDFGRDRPSTTVCQWCGAGLPDPAAETCPSCHGRLRPVQADLEVPGLTALGPEARAIQARIEVARLREAARRGEIVPQAASAAQEAPPPIPPPVLGETELVAAVQPPDEAVRRVMLEMEVAARRSALEREMQPLEMGDQPESAATPDDTADPSAEAQPVASEAVGPEATTH
ncbi:MAG TPA: hypothetical protein VFW92_01800 [Candidatus Limnocylindrales bacterium]|nr:hypothetical protein [Candidatus Limnocylindrales bacterium]